MAPFAVLVVGVLLVALLPPAAQGGADAVAEGAAPDSSALPVEAVAGDTPAATVVATDTPVTLAPAAGPAGAAAAAATDRPAAAPGARYPGIGTAEALANPNCDPATGQIRYPSRLAPPCVAPWPKGADNGGATSMGVTAETVRVLWYIPSSTRNEEDIKRIVREAFDIFNHHFEFWGRQIEPVFLKGAGTDEIAQRADATKAVTDIKPFLSTGLLQAGGEFYASTVAQRGIVHLALDAPWRATQAQPGFRWAANSDERFIIAHAMEYVGKRLAGRPARHAGDATYRVKPRVFGLIHAQAWERNAIKEEAARNNVVLADSLDYNPDGTAAWQERLRVMLSRLKAEGVTTVILGTDVLFNVFLSKEATAQQYSPEWILTGTAAQDAVIISRLNDQQQWTHAFGVGPIPPLPTGGRVEVATGPGTPYFWHHGRSASTADSVNYSSVYTAGFALSSCLQLAGPHLTPESYRNGCFAYPPTGGSFCNCVTSPARVYGPGYFPWTKYSWYTDMTEKWWKADELGQDEFGVQGPGMYMKVDGAKRYLTGAWPTADPKVFVTDGAIDEFENYPAGEEPRGYLHTPHG